jgi:hypothetical protein
MTKIVAAALQGKQYLSYPIHAMPAIYDASLKPFIISLQPVLAKTKLTDELPSLHGVMYLFNHAVHVLCSKKP